MLYKLGMLLLEGLNSTVSISTPWNFSNLDRSLDGSLYYYDLRSLLYGTVLKIN